MVYDDDSSSIMGVGAGMTGEATTNGTRTAFGAAGIGVRRYQLIQRIDSSNRRITVTI